MHAGFAPAQSDLRAAVAMRQGGSWQNCGRRANAAKLGPI